MAPTNTAVNRFALKRWSGVVSKMIVVLMCNNMPMANASALERNSSPMRMPK